MSQMIFSGSAAAISLTKSQPPVSITPSMMSVAARSTAASVRRNMPGVKPRDTMRRSRV